jgi:hypothetical protein
MQSPSCGKATYCYRILDSHVMDEMCGSEYDDMDLDEVIRNVVDQLVDTTDNGPADKGLEKWFDEWCNSAPNPPAKSD